MMALLATIGLNTLDPGPMQISIPSTPYVLQVNDDNTLTIRVDKPGASQRLS
jgi:hypothetical protein